MSDLDELMARDPLDLSSTDIDKIIAYHRAQRVRRAAGEKPTKPTGPKVDISDLMNNLVQKSKPPVQISRRKL